MTIDWSRVNHKETVNKRRLNDELMRRKIALASFINVPRLIKKPRFENNPRLVSKS